MGSTGLGNYAKGQGRLGEGEEYEVKGGVNFKGNIPEGKGLEKPGANKVTLKFNGPKNTNIIFQFKLTKDNKDMTIIGYRDGVPEVKSKVAVDAGQPSLDKVIATGNKKERVQANKMKELFSQSQNMSEKELGPIAQKLLRKKTMNKK